VKSDSPDYQLRSSLEHTFEQLTKILHAFPEAAFNRSPETGGWSAAQVTEHLRKSYASIDRIEQADTVCTRNPREKCDLLKSVFLDYSRRFEAAPSIRPASGEYIKENLLLSLQQQKERILKLANRPDLSYLCTSLPVPFFGELSQYEWLCLYDYHTQRHTEQVRVIFSNLTNQ